MRRPLPALFLLLLSACGTTTSTAPAVDASRVDPSRPSAGFVRDVLDLTNAARAQGRHCGTTWFDAAPPLRYSAALERAAVGHADDMAARNYFSHTSADGRTFDERITATGYRWAIVAENIAAGQLTPQEVVQAWLDSEGHCADIMAADLVEVGIAYTVASGGRYGTYWVQDFGTPR